MLISLSPSSKSTGARERGIVYVDIWPGRAKGRKVSLASVASPAETVVLIQPLLCFAPLLHPRRLSCVGTTSSALQQENSIVGRQKLFNHWNSCRPDPCNVTRNRRNTLFCSLSARRVPAGLRLCRVRPPARTTTRSVGSTDALSLSRIFVFARSTHKTLRKVSFLLGHRDTFPGKRTAPSPETRHVFSCIFASILMLSLSNRCLCVAEQNQKQ